MTEPVDSLAAALAQTQLDAEFESPPPLSDCATASSNSVQTLQSATPPDVEVVSAGASPDPAPSLPSEPTDAEGKRPAHEPAEALVEGELVAEGEREGEEIQEAKGDSPRRDSDFQAQQASTVEGIRAGLSGEETVVQDAPSGTALDAVPADAGAAELGKLAQYSRAIHEFTLKLYVRAERESIAKGHTLPGEYLPPLYRPREPGPQRIMP